MVPAGVRGGLHKAAKLIVFVNRNHAVLVARVVGLADGVIRRQAEDQPVVAFARP